ncbi:MAG: superoxide dismutase family protein [Microcoleaceae cyanobacterium]
MKKLVIILLAGLFSIIAIIGCGQRPTLSESSPKIVATATIVNAPDNQVTGTVTFIQEQPEGILPTVEVRAEVTGLPPNTIHGLHIHEIGTCAPDFGAAGGHFDPGPYGESNPDANHPFHMGDLPNLVADASGKATVIHRTSRITLTSGPLSILDDNGSTMIVHVDEDKGTTGVKGGAGGGRLGCGVIQAKS